MKSKTKQMVQIALFTALLCIFSQIVIPVGTVPFSLSLFAVALIGAMLPPLPALACVACYIAMGLVGLPVFAGFKGGFAVLFGATGGFLIGYFFIAAAASLSAGKKVAIQISVTVVGVVLCHLAGCVWFMFVYGTSFAQSVLSCSLPFILPDIIKIVLAVLLAVQIKKRLKKGSIQNE